MRIYGVSTTKRTQMRMLGEGVVDSSIGEASSLNEASLAIGVVISLVAIGLTASNYLEPATDPRKQKKNFVIRWVAQERAVYESLGGLAEISEEGLNSRSFESLEETNAFARLLERQLPGVRYSTYKVRGRAVTQLKQFGGQPPPKAQTDPQSVWDEELSELAEQEAKLNRGPVDKEWTAFRRRNLELGRGLKEEFDIEIIGGDRGKAPCRLCNGKGVRSFFGEERPCDWCDGTGVDSERSPPE